AALSLHDALPSSSRLAISWDSVDMSKRWLGWGVSTGSGGGGADTAFSGLGAVLVTTFSGVRGAGGGAAGSTGDTVLISLSWKTVSSGVLGAALSSRVPLPCWSNWAR